MTPHPVAGPVLARKANPMIVSSIVTASPHANLEKMAAIGEASARMSHDVRNVLQTVISSLELIIKRADNPAEVKRLANSALHSSDLGAKLVNQLLTACHRDGSPTTGSTCLVSSLRRVSQTLAGGMDAGTQVRICGLREDLWPANVDPAEFELAIINLALNARDAMPDGGCIELSARNVQITDRPAHPLRPRRGRPSPPLPNLVSGDYIVVRVTDNGVGMDEVTAARAAEPFFTTKPPGKGTGLGLAIARELAHQRGGTLTITSQLGMGTTVEMWLPRATATCASSTLLEPPRTSTQCRPRRMRVASSLVSKQPAWTKAPSRAWL